MHRAVRSSRLFHRIRDFSRLSARTASTQAQKRAGDISDAFVSLSGQKSEPLGPEYAELKGQLIKGHEEAVHDSWRRLLKELQSDVTRVAALGSNVIPEIDFKDVDNPSEAFQKAYKETGVAVVRQAIPEKEALDMKEELRDYIKANPQTKAFPSDNPQVFELYWSRAQLRARGHPNILKTQQFLMSPWHSLDPTAPISTAHPTSYADRLRMRQPGDVSFSIGPHIDGGSVERWDPRGYGGRDGVYSAIWRGAWEAFDPWESSSRLPVKSDLHAGVGACSMFRMSQGWLSLSTAGPGEGTLLVNPLLNKATAYLLLRPFFSPRKPAGTDTTAFLHPDNWVLDASPTPHLPGASPGHGQELSLSLHPHLALDRSMIHMPRVRPGDYVAWHCDTIHAVDPVHRGHTDSSVLYIPACPLTLGNAKGLAKQRRCFVNGWPSPDFGGGEGESAHVGRVRPEEYESLVGEEGRRAMGLEMWDDGAEGLGLGQREVLNRANKVLGFYQ